MDFKKRYEDLGKQIKELTDKSTVASRKSYYLSLEAIRLARLASLEGRTN